MKFITDLIQTLFVTIQPVSTIETLEWVEVKLNCLESRKQAQSCFEEKLNLFHRKDDLRITITYDEEPLSFETTRSANQEFWNGLKRMQSQVDVREEVAVTVTITRKDRIIHVYCLDSLVSYLSGLSVKGLLDDFNKQLQQKNKLVFESLEFTKDFSTGSMFFSRNAGEMAASSSYFERQPILSKLNAISHFTGMENCLLVPQDFYFESMQGVPPELANKFSQACFVLLLAYLNDNAYLQDEVLSVRLNGYKSLAADIDSSMLPLSSLWHYYKIYRWIIDQGSPFDKSGLARNILSLNIAYPKDFAISEDVFVSIISGYKLYEKQNVKQYIDLRNKMSDQLLGFNEKASKIIENFAGGFQKSALAFVSFFSSVIVIRVLTSNNFSNIFTLPAIILCFAFLLISGIYYRVSLWELREQRKRFVTSYSNMKKRNLDLLSQEDIDRILNNDLDFESDLSFIDNKKKAYSRLWKQFMLIFLIITIFLYGYNRLNLTAMIHQLAG